MEITALLVLLALAQFMFFAVRVGGARGKFGVNAPSTRGDEMFERLYRVQMNTLEQLAVFIPSLLLFTMYASARWAWIPGIIYLVGRQLYAWEYEKNPSSRTPGMALTLLANAVLLVGALIGVVIALFK